MSKMSKMTKSKKRHLNRKTKKYRKHRKYMKNMKGGKYTDAQVQQLLDLGVTREFLKLAYKGKIGFNILLNSLHGFLDSGRTTQEYMQSTYDDLEIDPNDGMTSDEEESDQDGGKKTRKYRKNMKGGTLYGRGYGANCYDPNYSIYNTNLLKLFPYSAK